MSLDSELLSQIEELHVEVVGEVLGLSHEVLEVLTGPVLDGGHIASLVVVLLCKMQGGRKKADKYCVVSNSGRGSVRTKNVPHTTTVLGLSRLRPGM